MPKPDAAPETSAANAAETEKQNSPPRPAHAPVAQVEKASRTIELQHALLVLGALLLLGLTFYGGTKVNYIRYLLATREKPELDNKTPDRFPGVAPADLVNQALVAQKEGRWEDAVERFMAAKHKDLQFRGILLRVGNILYDHKEFEAADQSFERAIAFGEDVDLANHYRGLIAVRRKDLPAAEQFFQSAAVASPFVADYQYYCGETFRLDLKPKQAIPFYRQAELLARREQDATVCAFKIRMARIEATEGDAVSAELAKKAAAGPLPVDWLMTSAALELRAGHPEAARAAIAQAREGKAPGLFVSCVNDFYFKDAVQKFPELHDVLHLDDDMQVPFP